MFAATVACFTLAQAATPVPVTVANLVGTWKIIRIEKEQVPPHMNIFIEYTADGQFCMRLSGDKLLEKHNLPEIKGKYNLEKNVIRSIAHKELKDKPVEVAVSVDFLSKNIIILKGLDTPIDQFNTGIRIKKN